MIWVKRWALDTREEIDGAGLVDPRVTHLWDAGNVIGQGFLDRFGVTFGGLDYDFFLLFDREATWGATPPRPVSSGATVIGDSDRLAEERGRPAALKTVLDQPRGLAYRTLGVWLAAAARQRLSRSRAHLQPRLPSVSVATHLGPVPAAAPRGQRSLELATKRCSSRCRRPQPTMYS